MRHRGIPHSIVTYLGIPGSLPSLIVFVNRKVKHALNTKARALRNSRQRDKWGLLKNGPASTLGELRPHHFYDLSSRSCLRSFLVYECPRNKRRFVDPYARLNRSM